MRTNPFSVAELNREVARQLAKGSAETFAWFRANRATVDRVLAELRAAGLARLRETKGKGHWKPVFAPIPAAPGPGERGHVETRYNVDEVAAEILAEMRRWNVAPDTSVILATMFAAANGELEGELDEVLDDHFDMTVSDLCDIAGIPRMTAFGVRFPEEYRGEFLLNAAILANAVTGASSEDWDADWGDASEVPEHVAVAVIADWLLSGDPDRLRLVPVKPDDACAFVEEHHSAYAYCNPRGFLYSLGVRKGPDLVAVATVNTPTGQGADQADQVELSRVASNRRAKGASSMLVARLIDLLPKLARGTGKPVLITYSLTSEEGTTYRALRDKGLRPTAFSRGKKPSGARKGGVEKGDRARAALPKVVWEAGPGAAPEDPTALEKAAAYEALHGTPKMQITPE